MRAHRSLRALFLLVPLTCLSGCFDSSGGIVKATNGHTFVQRIESPTQGRCHNFTGPVTAVQNLTGVDIRLHQGRDCVDPKGTRSFYLVESMSAGTTPALGLWSSFSTVGQVPPFSS